MPCTLDARKLSEPVFIVRRYTPTTGAAVPDVEAGLLLGQQLVAASHLGEARYAGAHGQALLPALDPLAELVVEHGALRARAYEAHPFCQDEKTRLRRHFMREAALDADFEDTF